MTIDEPISKYIPEFAYSRVAVPAPGPEARGDATVPLKRSIILIIMVIVGYQTPRMGKLAEIGHWLRNMLSDSLLGIIFGAINGYLLFGTVLYYMAAAHYPFPFVIAPDPSTAIGQKALEWISMLPPAWLMQTPLIYIAVAVCFIFVLVAVI